MARPGPAPFTWTGLVEIYGLFDPETDELRYVGKANNSAARFKGHLREVRRRKTPLYDWMRKLLAAGKCPACRVIRVCTQSDWPQVEREEIQRARSDRLLNLAEGGNQPFCPKSVSAANAITASVSRSSTPEKNALYLKKTALGRLLKVGHVSEKTKALMRLAAFKHPDLLGQWANI